MTQREKKVYEKTQHTVQLMPMQMLCARIAFPAALMLAIKLAIWWRFAIPLALLGV
jgi:hypothetical protein